MEEYFKNYEIFGKKYMAMRTPTNEKEPVINC
jgi:hypothetical protein